MDEDHAAVHRTPSSRYSASGPAAVARAAHRGRRESTARGGRTAPLVAARGAGLQVADDLEDQLLLLALGDEVVAALLQRREGSLPRPC
ncbi:hypothetical protein ACWDRZ_30380 [Streptomyces sp. NPDC003509]